MDSATILLRALAEAQAQVDMARARIRELEAENADLAEQNAGDK